MTTKAQDLVRQITGSLSRVEQELRAHPYPRGFFDGSAPVEALIPFLGHQYHVILADIRSAALMVHRFDATVAGGLCRGFLEAASAGRAGIRAMAAKIGRSELDLEAYRPSAEGFAYGAYVSFLASQGTAAEVLCGFLVNLPAWGHSCGQIGQGLREHHGWPKQATAFVDGFAERPPFTDQALPVIQDGLDRGESPEHIARAAHLIQSYEKMFWDAVSAEAGLG